MEVRLNEANFEYDIHSLIKAFYPQEDVHVTVEETGVDYSGFKVFYPQGVKDNCLELFYYECGKEISKTTCVINSADRGATKNILKQQLYSLLAEVTGKELPWGTLTGIRPTKIAMTMLDEGAHTEQIRTYMKQTYYASDDKIALCCEIAKREREIMSRLHGEQGFSLYVGIPFCPTTCLYCSFTSYPIAKWAARVEDYLSALEREIDLVAEVYQDRILDTVYIGGGTPTTLSPEQLERLITYIKSKFDFEKGPVREFTVEAGRPDSITEDKLETLYRNGVTRISINPQTMNEETLKVIGRRHTIADVIQSFQLARKIGFDNINMDFILGLPGEVQTPGEYGKIIHSMEEMKKLSPDSITVHSMAIKRAAGMHQWLAEHAEVQSINTPEMMEIAAQAASDLGMEPYYLYRQKNMAGNFENVGYAREGKEGIYNILIMEEKQSIAAVGAGTISKVVLPEGRIERCDNVKDITLYLEKIDDILDKKKKFYAIMA
ncbi:MAG TPA: coproporphyrinogen dehydrogenase HemZ [Lachnospiraceae bacterium]|nr:coproporphyrinogen dehydrogenase HemZ [Lachnospiraceae bacterium]